jgi:hypothetical protein
MIRALRTVLRADHLDALDVAQPQIDIPRRRARIVEPYDRVDARLGDSGPDELRRRTFGDSAGKDIAIAHRDAHTRLTRQLHDKVFDARGIGGFAKRIVRGPVHDRHWAPPHANSC